MGQEDSVRESDWNSMNRREFVRSTAGASAGLIAGARLALAADAQVEIGVDKLGAEISPHLYGQFIEHLGGVIYDGIWVGKNSKIANVGGFASGSSTI